jgi:hypothetical protein
MQGRQQPTDEVSVMANHSEVVPTVRLAFGLFCRGVLAFSMLLRFLQLRQDRFAAGLRAAR